MRSGKKRITVGMLVSGLIDEFTISITKGALRMAKDKDVNLVVMPCKYLGRDLSNSREIMYEYQYNTMLMYPQRDNLDALLIAADCIGCYIDKERIMEMLKYYDGIPSVLIASKIDGYVGVNYDNFNGIKDGLEYLIHQLHCSRICMLGGPRDNTDSMERREAFLKVLADNGIAFEERQYVEGTLSRYNEEPCKLLIDRNPDMEAVFCVNDETALGLCEELKKRGRQVGKDVYVFGYDNTFLAAKYKPALSSVWAEPSRLGERAMELLLRMLDGEKVEREVLPTVFIKRDSFGGGMQKMQGTGGRQEEIFRRIMEKIVRQAEDDANADKIRAEIMQMVEEFTADNSLESADIDILMMYMEQAFYELHEEKKIARPQKILLDICRKIIDAMDSRFAEMENEKDAVNYAMKVFVKESMQFDRGNDQSYQVLLKNLTWLNIQNAYVYTFQRPMLHLADEEFRLPEQFYLKTVMRDGVVSGILPSRQPKKLSELFCNEEIADRRSDMVLLPLFSNEVIYGVVLCDLSEDLFENGEFLVNQMGSAAKMMELLRENERISKSDGLTGLLNRRGFFDAAEEFLQQCSENGRKVLAAYADMDNLKIVNDRYGHDEGDFALRLIGDVLAKTVGENGVVGRIGGDEFVFVTAYDIADGGEDMCGRLSRQFASFNAASDKKYNVGISVGTYLMEDARSVTLEDALALADEKLYERKRHRTRSVEKNV